MNANFERIQPSAFTPPSAIQSQSLLTGAGKIHIAARVDRIRVLIRVIRVQKLWAIQGVE